MSLRAFRGYPSSLRRLLPVIKRPTVLRDQDREFILEQMLDTRCHIANMGERFMLPKGVAGIYAIVVSRPATRFGEGGRPEQAERSSGLRLQLLLGDLACHVP